MVKYFEHGRTIQSAFYLYERRLLDDVIMARVIRSVLHSIRVHIDRQADYIALLISVIGEGHTDPYTEYLYMLKRVDTEARAAYRRAAHSDSELACPYATLDEEDAFYGLVDDL